MAQEGVLPGPLVRVYRRQRQRAAGLLTPRNIIILFTILALSYLVLGPLGMLLLSSIKSAGNTFPFEPSPFTLDNYRGVLSSARTYRLLGNTAVFSLGSLLVGGSLALLFAWLVERTDLRMGGAFAALLIVPMGIPPVLTAIAYVYILDPRIGVLNVWTRSLVGMDAGEGPFNIYSLSAMFFVQGLVMVPTLFLMISAAFRNMDPALEEAGQMSGASWRQVMSRVTFPVLAPALLAAFIYFLVVVSEAFEIPAAIGLSVGIPVFATEIYNSVNPVTGGLPDYGRASALSMIIVVFAAGLLSMYFWVTRRSRSFGTVTGKGYRPKQIELGRWQHPMMALMALYLILSVGLVLAILLWLSLRPFYAIPSIDALGSVSLRSYLDLLARPSLPRVLYNTLVLGVLAATATVVVSFAISWINVRTDFAGRKPVDAVAFLSQAIPGVVVGLAVLVLHVSLRIPIYGTVLLIAVGLTAKYLAFGTRAVSAGYLQIDRELDEAAAVSGAGVYATFRRVSLPLLMPAALNAWVWVFLHAMRELSVAATLYAPGSVVLSTEIWSSWVDGEAASAAALGVLLFAISMIVSLGARKLAVRSAGRARRRPRTARLKG